MPSSLQIVALGITLLSSVAALPNPQTEVASVISPVEPPSVDSGSWVASATAVVASSAPSWAQESSWAAVTSAAPLVTSAAGPVSGSGSGSASDDWLQHVTYPAGCESWANPCPSGAIIAGGSTAGGAAAPVATNSAVVGASSPSGFTNGFTSFTTMTNSNGVITGQPSVITAQSPAASVPAGASGAAVGNVSIGSAIAAPSKSTAVQNAASSTFDNSSFVQATADAATLSNGAGVVSFKRGMLLASVAAVAMTIL